MPPLTLARMSARRRNTAADDLLRKSRRATKAKNRTRLRKHAAQIRAR